jgi:hypothetical protein
MLTFGLQHKNSASEGFEECLERDGRELLGQYILDASQTAGDIRKPGVGVGGSSDFYPAGAACHKEGDRGLADHLPTPVLGGGPTSPAGSDAISPRGGKRAQNPSPRNSARL